MSKLYRSDGNLYKVWINQNTTCLEENKYCGMSTTQYENNTLFLILYIFLQRHLLGTNPEHSQVVGESQ